MNSDKVVLYYNFQPRYGIFAGMFLVFNFGFILGLIFTNLNDNPDQSLISLFSFPENSSSQFYVSFGFLIVLSVNYLNFSKLINDLRGYSQFTIDEKGENLMYFESKKREIIVPFKQLSKFEIVEVENYDSTEYALFARLYSKKSIQITRGTKLPLEIGPLISEKLNIELVNTKTPYT